MAISGAVASLMINAGYSGPVAMLGSLLVGLLAGLINGSLVAFLKIQPIVATLILMVSGRGVAQLLTDGYPIPFQNEFIERFGSGFFLALPFSVTLIAITLVVIGLLVRSTALGLYLNAVLRGCYAPGLAAIIFLQIFLGGFYRTIADHAIGWLKIGLREPDKKNRPRALERA